MLSPIDRPFLLREIAMAFDEPVNRLESVVRRNRIDPAMWAGRTRLYGPQQIRAIYAALIQSA
jgi:hypothetical protein